MNYIPIFVLPLIIFFIFVDGMGGQRTPKRIKKVKGFKVKPLPNFRVRGLSRKLKMIDFGIQKGKWPLKGGRGFKAEEKMPISDAKIAADKAVIEQYVNITDQMQNVPTVGAKSTKISNKLDSLPKPDAKEVTINNDQKIANKQPNNAPKSIEIKLPISDAKIAAEKAVIKQCIKVTDKMHEKPIVDARELSISKIENKQSNNAPKSNTKIAIKKKDVSGKNSNEENRKQQTMKKREN